jgi:hypothetical protein
VRIINPPSPSASAAVNLLELRSTETSFFIKNRGEFCPPLFYINTTYLVKSKSAAIP